MLLLLVFAVAIDAALYSYGSSGKLDLIPRNYIRFLESCRSYFGTDTDNFLHPNSNPEVPLEELDETTTVES